MTLLSPAISESTRVLDVPTHDPDHVRGAMGRFPTGVVALCAIVDGRRVGMVASSFSAGASYSPPMVMFSVQESSTTWPVLHRAERIGVSVLGSHQSDACMQLASRSRDRFEGLATTVTAEGAVLVDGAAMWFDCDVYSCVPAGDHSVVVMRVHSMNIDDEVAPLIYHERRFHGLREIDGGRA
ncbi:flavin reductase family protein [Microbacterium aquimaris]|uniref:Flavin reductase family protein n=1 Tax=Microbacterium aquimaris TaxID=459816 RepID=A0ABU5N534_9MICO|nr:flavin reductase family protein [Microbacterium aquimaris]MDZ8161188.1 flavin reductase family protein [Microbacterium aquimaris]